MRQPVPYTQPDPGRIQRLMLETYDDATSVRDRLQFVKAGRVLLVFPRKGGILQRKLDLVLIQRECARRNLRMALITRDPQVLENARDLNISTFSSAEQARTARWKRPAGRVFVDRSDRPHSSHDTYDLMMAASRLKPPATPARQTMGRLIRGVAFGVMLLALLIGFYMAVPGATVTITPARGQVNTTVSLTADPSITAPIPESRLVPARKQRFLQDATVTVETTGVRPADDSLATVTVVFTNETEDVIEIPAGTIVRTDGTQARAPVEFETLEAAQLPAEGGTIVDVKARARATSSSSGPNGNVDVGTIETVTGPLSGLISVTNPLPATGGSIQEVEFVTPADQERLRTFARQQVLQNARNYLITTLDENQSLFIEESLVIVEERSFYYSFDVNTLAENVSLTMQVVVEATIVDLQEAQLVAVASVRLPSGQRVDEETVRYYQGDVRNVNPETGVIVFEMRLEGTTYAEVNTAGLAEQLAGVSEDEARSILEREYLLDPTSPPEIRTFPGFFNRMPMLPVRIQINVQN